jgi:hypothetical protein
MGPLVTPWRKLMIESLAALATAASTTLVASMATDAWQAARTGILRVLRRGNDEPALLAAQLDSEAALVLAADDAEAARQSLLPGWRLRLEQFLRDDPEAADGLRELTERLTTQLPQAQQHWVQNNEAHDNSQVFGVQNGNVIIHQAAAEPGVPQSGSGHGEPGAGRGGSMT